MIELLIVIERVGSDALNRRGNLNLIFIIEIKIFIIWNFRHILSKFDCGNCFTVDRRITRIIRIRIEIIKLNVIIPFIPVGNIYL